MSEATNTILNEEGPSIYENWKAALAGKQSQEANEYPLFTDADITGAITSGYGPYQLLNAFPMWNPQVAYPAIVLRVDVHWVYDYNISKKKETDVVRYHGGSLPDEVAALVSLSLGIRLMAGGPSRLFSAGQDPRGYPTHFSALENPILHKPIGRNPILPKVLGTHNLNEITLLPQLPDLSSSDAVALVRSARLYQDAVWIAESTPELSWLMLVSAVETAANHWRKDQDTPSERLKASRPKFAQGLFEKGGDALVSYVADNIAESLGATKKFKDFIQSFLPEPPDARPTGFRQHSWDPKDMNHSMGIIYTWRSRALHDGIPFPKPMCLPPMKEGDVYWEKPTGLSMGTAGSVWLAEDTPMLLHVFEYIVRGALLKWWESMLPAPQGQV